MSRFRHSQVSNVLSLEKPLFDLVGSPLVAMGHAVISVDGAEVGGVQSIMFVPEPGSALRGKGYYRSGSDFRKDGQAVGW
jgi:gamma-glutamyltranspeptidase/glutathione hydrolase